VEKIVQFEKLASENLSIAESNRKVAKRLKSLAKSELDRSKAMSQLVKKELEMTKIRKEVAEEMKNLVEEKLKLKDSGVLKFSDTELKKEIQLSIYNGKVAIMQKLIAENQQKLADLEEEIAKERQKYAKETLNFAKKREDLSKKLNAYINTIKEESSDNQILKAKKSCEKLQQDLIKEKKTLLLKEKEIKMMEIRLANLERELSAKFSELEQIRNS